MKTKNCLILIIAMVLSFVMNVSAQLQTLYEDFEGGIPSTWEMTYSSSTYKWSVKTGGYNATKSVSFNSYNSAVGTTSTLMSPMLSLTSDRLLSFAYKNAKGGEYNVYVYKYAEDGTYEEFLLEGGLVATDWTLKSYQLESSKYSGNIKIAFKGVSNKSKSNNGAESQSEGNLFLDNVVVEDIPLCAQPIDLDLVALSQTTATLMWNIDAAMGSVPTSYRIIVKDVAGNIVGDYNDLLIEGDGYIYMIEGLESNKEYVVSLRSDCTEDNKGVSKYSDEFTFRTLCEPIALPYIENFDAAEQKLSNCWNVNPNNKASVVVSGSGYGYGGSGYSIKMAGHSSLPTYVVTDQFVHAANDMEVSFMVFCGEKGVPFSVGLTNDALSTDGFEILWNDTTIDGWKEVRFCSDATYYGDAENMSVFIMIPAGEGGKTIYIDNFSVKERPACPRIEKVRVVEVLSSEVTIGWTEFGNTGNYEIEVTNLVNAQSIVHNAQSTNAPIKGLEGNTTYSVRVRSICSATESSEWSDPIEFRTNCGVMENNEFTESFEASNNLIPECWQVYGEGEIDIFRPTGSSNFPGVIVDVAKEGNKVLRFLKTGGVARAAIVTQSMQIDEEGVYDVSFWFYRNAREIILESGEVATEAIRVLVNNRPSAEGAIELDYINAFYGHTPQVDGPGWYQYEYNIPLSGEVFFIIEAVSVANGNDKYIDDIEVIVAPTCRRVGVVEMLPATLTEYKMAWEKGADETEWVVKYRLTHPETFATLASGEERVSGTPQFTLGGLSSSSEYRITGRVAAYCGVGDTSEWVEFDYKFATECEAISVFPHEEKFEGKTFPPLCWKQTTENGMLRIESGHNDAHEGASVMLRAPGYGQALITPQYEFEAGKEYRVSFMMKRLDNIYGAGIKVMVNDKQDTAGAQELLYIPTYYLEVPKVTEVGYYEYKVDFTATGSQYIMFVQTSESVSSSNDYIDNVKVMEKPACEPVVNFEVRDVDSYSAKVVLLDLGVTTCEAVVCAEGVAPDAGVVYSSDSAVIVLDNLIPSTTYDVYVRNRCGEVKGELSDKVVTIVTHCEPFEVTMTTPFVEDFEGFVLQEQLKGCYLSEGSSLVIKDTDASISSMKTAYSGELFAWLQRYGSATIYRPLRLKAGVNYEISAYAVQGGSSSYISLGYTKLPNIESVNFVLYEETVASEWNKNFAYFQVPVAGVYYLAMKVYASDNLGIDDIVVKEVSCIPPTTSVTGLTSSTATIKIDDLTAGEWILSVSNMSFNPEEVGNILHSTVTSEYTELTELQPNTTYYYSVKSICGEGDESTWSEIRTFKTKCTAVSVPFTEGFEADVDCWTFLGDEKYANNPESSYADRIHTGLRSLWASKVTLVSPELDVETLADYMVTGWVKASVNLPETEIRIGVMTDPEDISTFEVLGYYKMTKPNVWEQFTVYLSDLNLDDYADYRNARYVVIIFPNEDVLFFVDDIEVKLAPTCSNPVEVKYDEVGTNSCTLSWVSKGVGDRWNVVGYKDGVVAIDTIVDTNPATIEGLQHSTTYEFEIRTICSDTTVSDFAKFGPATTACAAWELPYLENFDRYKTDEIPQCWEVLDNEGWSVEVQNKIGHLYFPTNAQNVEKKKSKIVSPEFDLTQEIGALLHFDLLNTPDTLTIKLSIDGGSTYGVVLGEGYTEMPTYTPITFDLTPYVGNKVRVMFEGTATGDPTTYLFIDNFEVEKIEACARPVDLVIKSVGEHSVTIEINDTTGASAWEYIVDSKRLALDGEKPQICKVTENPFTIEGLYGFTNYPVKVRTDCGDKQSSWNEVSFKTLCAAVNAVPYYDSFEDIENVREACYTMLTNSTSATLPTCGVTYNSSEGRQGLFFLSSKDYPMMLVLPQFDIPTTSLQLTLDYLAIKGNSSYTDLRIGVITDVEDVETFHEVAVFTPFEEQKDAEGNYKFQEIKVVFNVLDNEFANANIALCVAPTTEDYKNVYIDNLIVERAPSCPDVYKMDLVSTESTSAKIYLDYKSSAVQLAYGPSTQDIDSMARVISVLDTVELEELSKGVNYAVYARSVCGTDTGSWIQPLLFGTDCDVYEFDVLNGYEETFNTYGTHPLAFPTCYTRISSIVERGIEYPKLTQAKEGEGDKNVLHLYKESVVALPEFDVPVNTMTLSFDMYNPSTGTYFEIGLQDDLSDESTYQLVKEYYVSQERKSVKIDLFGYNAKGKYLVFKGTATTKDVYIDNIRLQKAPECFDPRNLKPELIGDTFAVLTWVHSPSAQGYECELSSSAGIEKFDVDTAKGRLLLTDLEKETTYQLKLRTKCTSATNWVEVEFTTFAALPTIPYICGFEEAEENSSWRLVGSQPNRFVVGAESNGSVATGDSALYVADAVKEYAYENGISSNIYAYRTFVFEAGDYIVSYDWKSNGEANQDYGRVFLAPIDIYISSETEIGAETLSDRYIPLHNENRLTGSTAWKHETMIFSVDKQMNYHLVVQWSNDAMGGENPPLSIDNIEIGLVTCSAVEGLTLQSAGLDEAVVVFENPENLAVEYVLSMEETTDLTGATQLDGANTIVLNNLLADTKYYLYVRMKCDEDQLSPWRSLVFETSKVPVPTNLVVDNITETSADLAWEGGLAEYDVRLMESSNLLREERVAGNRIVFEDLEAATSYKAQVRGVYGDKVSDWVEVVFNSACKVLSAPYFENFEQASLATIPNCWDNTTNSQLSDNLYNWMVKQPNEYDFVGDEFGRCMQIQCASADGYAMLVMPEIYLDAEYTFSFRYFNNSETEKLDVIVFNGDVKETLGTLEYNQGLWEVNRFSLSEYVGKTIRIAFGATAQKSASAVIAIDDIRVNCFGELEFSDMVCQPTQGTVIYRKHGFEVSTSSLKLGENVIEVMHEAEKEGECDTLKRLYLTMMPSGVYQYNDTICEGEVYNKGAFEGKNLVLPGYYDALLKSSCGCDSTVRLNLTVLHTKNAKADTICEGDVYTFGDKELTASGIYMDTLVNGRGCDSIVTLTLVVIPRYYEESRIVCEGEKVTWLDTTLTTTGRYERVFSSVSGCDSVVVMDLKVLPSNVEVFDTICMGMEYQFLDTLLRDAGEYVRTFQNVLRCDSTVHLYLHVVEPEPTVENDYVCEGELYNGYGYTRLNITQDTMLIQRISSPDGCDSLVHIYVDFIEKIEIDTTVVISEGDFYDFGENSLTKAGKYHEVFVSSAGCDSIVNLTLIVETGLDGVYAMPLVIAPNPVSSEEVSYISGNWTIEEQQGMRVDIVDARGEMIRSFCPTDYPIAIKGFAVRGIYFVRILTGTGDLYVGKIIVN